MERLAHDQEAELEESRTEVVEQCSVRLSEAVRMFLEFIADEAVRQVLIGAPDDALDGTQDSTEGDVPREPHARQPHR